MDPKDKRYQPGSNYEGFLIGLAHKARLCLETHLGVDHSVLDVKLQGLTLRRLLSGPCASIHVHLNPFVAGDLACIA